MSNIRPRRGRTDAAPSPRPSIVYRDPFTLREDPRNARTHSKKQIGQLIASIKAYGFTNPIQLDENGIMISGHARRQAAIEAKLLEVPTIIIAGLSEAKRRALPITDNKTALNASWNEEILAEELLYLSDPEIGLEGLTAFETPEIDTLLAGLEPGFDPSADIVPEVSPGSPVTQLGDIWHLGPHRVICGSATDAEAYEALMEGKHARMVIADPPYNVPIRGHVSGLGRTHHREFVQGSGELPSPAFELLLTNAMKNTTAHVAAGSIQYWFMDWRHQMEILASSKKAGLDFKNLVVWVKRNAGMGAFYRSQHELVYVLKQGSAPHVNNFGLGGHGRYRTNVWEYPGLNSFGRGRDELLAQHPTVKPVALVADAIKDVSHRGDIILDPFAGSGTVAIAAEKTKRQARLIELDPRYVDVVVRRWESYTGGTAHHAGTGKSFQEVADSRSESHAAR